MREQNKKVEITFFNNLARQQHYETTSKAFYNYLIAFLKKNRIRLQGLMLEAGCGSGVFAKRLMQESPNLKTIGVDIADQMVRRANDKTKNYRAIHGDLEVKSLFHPSMFDIVLCPYILHHFPRMDKVISNFNTWLRPGGVVIIFEPNGTEIINKLSRFVRWIVELVMGQNYIIKKSLATPNETISSLGEYKATFAKNGFRFVSFAGYHFNPIEKSQLVVGRIKDSLQHGLQRLFPGSRYFSSDLVVIFRKN